MRSLNEDLKLGQYKTIYLFYGEEGFLKKMYKKRFISKLCEDGDTINYNHFEGSKINVKELMGLADTMPFFAENRLIIIENSGFFKKPTAELGEYFSQIPETTHMIFVEEEVDKRGKMYKATQKYGKAVEFKAQDSKSLAQWIKAQFKQADLQVRDKTIQFLIETVGDDMFRLYHEVEKLIAYTMGCGEVTEDDIETVCVAQITDQMFKMVDAVSDKKQKEAFEYYYDLIALKVAPIQIFNMLRRHYRILHQMKAFEGTGVGNSEIIEICGIKPFLVRKYKEQIRRFEQKTLREILEEIAEMEETIKTGGLTDKLALELFIVKYSMA